MRGHHPSYHSMNDCNSSQDWSGARSYTPGQVAPRVSTAPCPGCGAPVQEDFVFCPNCGRQVLTPCEKCHRAVRTDWTHCPFCGADLIAEPAESAQPNK